jgi:hypothetical protein
MKVLHTIRETPPNKNGMCALSTDSDHCYLVTKKYIFSSQAKITYQKIYDSKYFNISASSFSKSDEQVFFFISLVYS